MKKIYKYELPYIGGQVKRIEAKVIEWLDIKSQNLPVHSNASIGFNSVIILTKTNIKLGAIRIQLFCNTEFFSREKNHTKSLPRDLQLMKM